MPKIKIDRDGDVLKTRRKLTKTTNGGLSFVLINAFEGLPENLGLVKGQEIEISQNVDGKAGSWRVIE